MNDRIKSCNELAGAAPEPVGEEVEVVGVAILGGLFYGGSGPELGDIDLELNPDVLERIQAELVNSSDDVMISLMTVTQHQRIVEGLQVTNYLQEVRLQDAFEVIDQLKAEVARLKQEKSDLKHSLTKSQQETYQAEVLMVEIGEERDRLKAEVERLKGQSIDDQKHMLGIIEERDQLKAEVEQLKARIVWLECEAKCAGKVVLPERRGVTTRKTAADYYNGGWNACLDEVQRLNGAKP